MDKYIKGNYRKSIFKSETGYVIGIFKVIETNIKDLEVYINRTITFTGYFHELNDNDTYKFFGEVIYHPKYGEQFQVSNYLRCKKEKKDEIIEFLSSGLFKGIGVKKATKIANYLGKDTFSVIINNPNDLLLIPTITEKNKEELHNKLLEYEESYEVILYLSKIGFTTKESMLIYNKYKEKTHTIIDNNIYQLIDDINELGYKKIDRIALSIGIKKNSIIRVKASIIYIMNELSSLYGHCYFMREDITNYLPRVMNCDVSIEEIDNAFSRLVDDLKLIVRDNKYYLFEIEEAEKNIVERLRYLSLQKEDKLKDINNLFNNLEEYFDIKYNSLQKEAIKKALVKKLLVITGGPGTGKTTIIKAILKLYQDLHKYSNSELINKVALLAPTGRAAKRMSEEALFPAATIHRFLKWNKETNTFQVNNYNKSKIEFLVIDEASMVDVYLFNSLLQGISVNTKILIVGDYDQLPSVGPGNVLRDIICSEVIDVIYLNEIYRQEIDSNILLLASDIKNNSLSKNIFNVFHDLTFISCSNDEVLDNISSIVETYIDKSYKEVQVLAPMYKTINGIDNINKKLQSIYNKKSSKKKELLVGNEIYREGDKVICLINMPDDNVYNGDIGIIEKVDPKNTEIHIDYDGNIVKYTASSFNKFRLAYAISVHKSQGSEFDIVILPLVTNYKKMLYKKLVYTAVTRCKSRLYIIGDFKCLEYAVNNNLEDNRNTTIKELLVESIK